MDSWLSSLKDLLAVKDGAKLTLPGVLSAALLLTLFLPPKPLDVIPVVRSLVNLGIKEPDSRPLGKFISRALTPRRADPACVIDGYFLKELPRVTGFLFQDRSQRAQSWQYILEEQNENIERCLASEKRLVDAEETAGTGLRRDLTMLETARAKQAAVVADYEIRNSPITGQAREQLEAADHAVETQRRATSTNEQKTKDRQWEIVELTRWKGIVMERLAEPGKLRPELGFDDYLSAMSKHVLAFVFLVIAVGMVVEGISTPGLLKTLESILFGS